jgi:capsular exopolysaccharide synthesis family protein
MNSAIPDSAKDVAPKGPDALTFGDLLAVIWRRRHWSLPVFLLATLLTAFSLFRTTPLYEATATIGVDNRQANTLSFSADASVAPSDISLLNTQRDLLTTNEVLEMTLKNCLLGTSPVYASAGPLAAKVLLRRIKFPAGKDVAWIIPLSLRDEDPDRAVIGLRTLLDSFLSKQVERSAERAKLALAFLSQSVAQQRSVVEEGRNKEQAFRMDNKVLGTDPDHNQYSDRLDALDSQQVDLERQIASCKATLDLYADTDALPEAERIGALMRIDGIVDAPVVLDRNRELADLIDQQIVLRQKYLDRHPRMVEITEQIANKKLQLREAVAAARASEESVYQQLMAQNRMLATSITNQEYELNVYRRALISLDAMTQEATSQENLLDHLLQRQGEEEVSSRLNSNIAQVVDPVTCDRQPANIYPSFFLFSALALGALMAVATSFLVEALDTRVRGPIGAQNQSGLTVVGQIPHMKGMKIVGRNGDPNQPQIIAEAFRDLRSALLLFAGRRTERSKVMLITSPGPGEGKSTVSVRLALSLASTGSRVLLIDADMRRPTLHLQLGMEQGDSGLSLLLAGEQGNEPVPTSFDNLDLLAVGIRPPNPSEILHGKNLADALEGFRKKYDHIIIDTPPVGIVSDALTIAEHVDQILLVARDRHTKKSALAHVMVRMEMLRPKIIGILLNGEQRERDRLYYYQYENYDYVEKPERQH